jgi:hypothetical protein
VLFFTKKIDRATFWAIFSQTLVTLAGNHQLVAEDLGEDGVAFVGNDTGEEESYHQHQGSML